MDLNGQGRQLGFTSFVEVDEGIQNGIVEVVFVIGKLFFEGFILAELFQDLFFVIFIQIVHNVEQLQILLVSGRELSQHPEISLFSPGKGFDQLEN